jgi:hypothetical protein
MRPQPTHPSQEDLMAHNHEHDCIVCGAHFDSLTDLDKHNRESHLRKSTGTERPRQDPSASESNADKARFQ